MIKMCLTILLTLCVIMTGCGEDSDSQDQKEFRIVSVAPNGGEIAPNAFITLTFNKKVSSVTVMINGNQIPVHASADGKTYTFTLGLPGDFILTVDAEDEVGQPLTGFEPVKFRALNDD